MTEDEVKDLLPGVYMIFWHDEDDGSVAAVGQLYDGTHWFASSNWTGKSECGIACTKWEMVRSIHPLNYDW